MTCSNMLRMCQPEFTCTCKKKNNDCKVKVEYTCHGCSYKTNLDCNICLICFPDHVHPSIESGCYDCEANERYSQEMEEGWL